MFEDQTLSLLPPKKMSFFHANVLGCFGGERPYSRIFFRFEWWGYHVRPPLSNKAFGCAPLGRRSTPCPRPTAGGIWWMGILRDLRVVSPCFADVFVVFKCSTRKDAGKWKSIAFGDVFCFPICFFFLSVFSLGFFRASFRGWL